jgi:CubicO group peptidase (beta-lactamase class C family)
MTRVEPGFELVAEEFERNFGERGEHGAAFAAVADGELVVDLWGGTADQTRGAPWREDTVCLVFSGAKGLVATCLLLLIERGKLELDAPLSRYWPQFGNERVLVRHAVSHTAGLPGIRAPVALLDLLDYERMTSLLEAEEPYWEPGTRLAYHALTFGWLCGELVRRIDGRTVGTFFAEEVAGPLGLELWLGLPDEVEPRVARLRRAPDYRPSWGDEADPLVETVYENPAFLTGEEFPWNDPAFRAAEIPGANAIGTARSIARLYGSLDRLLAPETLHLGRTALARDRCALTGRPYAFGVGFELQTELGALGPPAAAFGHTGAGGSRHGAWPEQRVGFSYAMNELRAEDGDERGRRLLAALARAVSSAGRDRASRP